MLTEPFDKEIESVICEDLHGLSYQRFVSCFGLSKDRGRNRKTDDESVAPLAAIYVPRVQSLRWWHRFVFQAIGAVYKPEAIEPGLNMR